MLGVEGLHALVKDSMAKYMDAFYVAGVYDPAAMEDALLATPEREKYQDIGTGYLKLDTLAYVMDNIMWINVCMFVNRDFRDCFKDAILIEKALLQVSEQDYKSFRDDMVLASDADRVDANKKVGVNLAEYVPATDAAVDQMLREGRRKFFVAGMTDVYDELSGTLEGECLDDVKFVVRNAVYFFNAMDMNGVFNKYVRIVVDNVKRQLAARPGA